jgi:cation:H+ antiporter
VEIAANFGWVALGGLVLYLGAEWLVKGASGLSKAFGVREVVIGLTVVAYGTSAPELAVSVSANLNGLSSIVLGNVVGSCVANIGLILGITALIAPPNVDGGLIRREVPILLFSACCLPLILVGGEINRIEGIGLLVLATGFTAFTFGVSKTDNTPSASDAEISAEAAGAPSGEGRLRLLFITLVGLGMLVGGGEIFLDGATGLAHNFGMSDRLVGLTIVAFGTSLPELAASVVAAMRGHSGLAIGNVVGSNIFNIFLVLGAAGTVRPMTGSISDLRLDLGFLVAMTVVGAIFMRTRRRISRPEGAFLVMGYVAFVVLAALGW